MPTVQIKVIGRVQGVGFRAFIARTAAEHDLTGVVWNGRDGSVGAVFQSIDAEKVRAALVKVYDGPGRVEKVVPQVLGDEHQYQSFEILSGTR